MKFEDALSLRASGHVKRWHTIRTLTQQTVAEHSGQALTLLLILHPDPSMNLVKALLWHDSSERLVGDIPAPIRRAFPSFAAEYEQLELVVAMKHHPSAIVDLTDDEKRWLKAIDTLELLMHVAEEIKLGNAAFRAIYVRALDYLLTDATPVEVREFIDWYESNGYQVTFA